MQCQDCNNNMVRYEGYKCKICKTNAHYRPGYECCKCSWGVCTKCAPIQWGTKAKILIVGKLGIGKSTFLNKLIPYGNPFKTGSSVFSTTDKMYKVWSEAVEYWDSPGLDDPE